MRKTTSRIARLPETIRTEINQKLDEGWSYKMIREWLFAQTAGQDLPALELKAGESYGAVWARTTKSAEHAADACEQALSNWYCKYFPEWVKEKKQSEKDRAVRLVERVKEIGQAAGEKETEETSAGANVVIRSMLFDAIAKAGKGESDSTELARLAQAWARVSDAGVEVERMNLRKQEALDVAKAELIKEIRQWPEARIAFDNFYNTVKRLEKGKGATEGNG